MLKEEIRKFFKGEILDDEAALATASRDASIFEIKPKLVVAPLDAGDLKALVKFVAEKNKKGEKLSLTARSAGTDMSGGPLTDSIVVDFTRHFNRIIGVDKKSMTATVQPGVYYRDFEKETLKKGLLLPSYPASRELCTVGGMVSNNSGGEKTLKYGKTEDYVAELKVVFSDGEEYVIKPLSRAELAKKSRQKDLEGNIYKKISGLIGKNEKDLSAAKPNVHKNSAGYYLWNVWQDDKFNLARLIVGSQGTLGFVTEITFRLVEPAAHSRLAVIFLNDLDRVADVAEEVLKFSPESFESYDDNTLKLALRFWRDFIKVLKGQNIFRVMWNFLPEVMMMIREGGIPKLILLAEFTGDDEKEILERMNGMRTALSRLPVIVRLAETEEAKEMWAVRRESFNLLRHHVEGMHTAPFIDDVIVRPDYLPQFLPRLNSAVAKYSSKLIYTIAGHVGDGNFHIIPLMKLQDPEARAVIPKLSEEVYDLVAEFRGSITAEHNDGLIRTPYLNKIYSQKILDLFAETKKIFDPQTIFNPGKKTGGSLEYSLSRISAFGLK